MPTGYTAAIKDGITFEQYAMACARAFGALVMMRDDASDATIPAAFEPSDTYSKWASEARAKLATLQAMSIEQVERAATAAHAEALASWEKSQAENNELRASYTAMLAQVEAWSPPTPEHIGLRDFMAQQINESIRFDCDYSSEKPVRQKSTTWHNDRIAAAISSIARYDAEHLKEVERTNGRNAWLTALRASLAAQPTGGAA